MAYSWAGEVRGGGRRAGPAGRLTRPGTHSRSCTASKAAPRATASVSWQTRSAPSSTSEVGLCPAPWTAALAAASATSMRWSPSRPRSQARKAGFSRSSVATAVTRRGEAGSRRRAPVTAAATPSTSAPSASAATRTGAGSPGWSVSSTRSSGASGPVAADCSARVSPWCSASSVARSTTRSVSVSSVAVTTRRARPVSQ